MKNLEASIRQRLLNLAKKEGVDFDYILRQFAIQRLLYRLSISDHSDRFYLKGALMFWVWDRSFHRPTKDIDLLGLGSNDVQELQTLFMEVVSIPCDDGLIFHAETIKAATIKEDEAYEGVRVTGVSTLDRASIPFQVDIGFGDVITPKAKIQRIPTYLDLPFAELKAYPVETIIAEKFQAMVYLDIANSRMKDFFDLWFIANSMRLVERDVSAAIKATFANRRTPIVDHDLDVFSSVFLEDTNKSVQWRAFKNKNRLDLSLSFSETQELIKRFLEPLYVSIAKGQEQNRVWDSKMWQWRQSESEEKATRTS